MDLLDFIKLAEKGSNYISKNTEKLKKKRLDRRTMLKILGISGGALTAAFCSGSGNGGNGTEIAIKSTFNADETLKGGSVSGTVRVFQGGTYNPGKNSGSLVREGALGDSLDLGSAKSGQSTPFDVVIESNGYLRSVFYNVAMSETKAYSTDILNTAGFNVGSFASTFLKGNSNNRWDQSSMRVSYHPDIAVQSASGETLFTMASVIPDKGYKERKKYKDLEGKVREAKGKVDREFLLKGKGIILYDEFEYAEKKWAQYLGKIWGVKTAGKKEYEISSELKKKYTRAISTSSQRLPDWCKDAVYNSLVDHIQKNSGVSVSNEGDGNMTAADLPPPNGAIWVFYDSSSPGTGNADYPGGNNPVDSARIMINPDKVSVPMLEHEAIDACYADDQDSAIPDDWIKFSFKRMAGGSYSIYNNFEEQSGWRGTTQSLGKTKVSVMYEREPSLMPGMNDGKITGKQRIAEYPGGHHQNDSGRRKSIKK